MSPVLTQYSVVEVVRLTHPPEHYDGYRMNRRPPAVGDTGTIVEILKAGIKVSYVVESLGADGATVWLSDFGADEIRPN